MVSFLPPRVHSKDCINYSFSTEALLAQTKSAYQLVIAANILSTQVAQESPAVPDELEQAALGTKIMAVPRHMIGQLLYPLGKNGHLDFGGTGVLIVQTVVTHDSLLGFFIQHYTSLT
jgi:hypothetical protein